MVIRFAPLQAPVLDPRSERELVRRCMEKVFSASGGKLNDFAIASPTRALLEAQAFAGAEWLYYLNLLPEAFSIRFLQVMGIQRRLGRAATGTVVFTLSGAQPIPYTIPKGFLVGSSSALYATDDVCVIAPGLVTGSVTVTCQKTGEIGNVGAFEVNRIIQPMSFLKTVGNPDPISGGLGMETLDEVKARAFTSLRRRGLVSADDYAQEAMSILGMGSVAFAVGLLGADAQTVEKGAVHLFVLNPGGLPLNSAQLSDLRSALSTKTHLGTAVYVSNVHIFEVDVEVIANIEPGLDPGTIAQSIYTELNEYLTPGFLPLGASILVKELEYEVRRVVGVSSIVAVRQGPALSPLLATDLQLPRIYSAAKLFGANITLKQGSQTYLYSYGNGDPD